MAINKKTRLNKAEAFELTVHGIRDVRPEHDEDEVVHLGRVEKLTGGGNDGNAQDGSSAPVRWKRS